MRIVIAALIATAVLISGISIFVLHRHRAPEETASTERLTIYSRSEFETLLSGKNKQEVIAVLGTPGSVEQGIDPGTEYYEYSAEFGPQFAVIDETTGLQMKSVSVWFNSTGDFDHIQY